MTNVTPTAPNPVTDKQMAAALVLADILDHGLPPVNWTICVIDAARLVGHVFHTVGTEAERSVAERETVRAFADFLGGEYREDRHDHRLGWTEVSTFGTYEGVRVRVWAGVDDKEAIANEADALAAAAAPVTEPVSA
jgi:hypothetical protein